MTMTAPAAAETTNADATSTAPTVAAAKSSNPNKGFGAMFWVATGWLAFVLLCAVGGKRLPWGHKDPDYLVSAVYNGGESWTKVFSWKHPLGVDSVGNDWLAIATQGARNSMIIAFATVVFGFLAGGGLGMLAGYVGGKLDTALSFLATVLISFPPLLFIFLLLTILAARGGGQSGVAQGLQSSVWKLSLALGVLSIPTLFRIVRASTMQFAGREFVVAAQAMGAKRGRILFREILPNVVKPMAAYGLVAAGSVMVIEGALSYLGIGIGDSWGWGKMIASGSSYVTLDKSPNIALVPIVILFITVLSFNFIGDKLRDKLEVKQAGI